MILDSENVELPEYVEPHTCQLFIYASGDPQFNPHSPAYAIQQVSVDTIREVRAKHLPDHLKAVPTCFAIQHVEKTSELMLWPEPDKEYHARFRYCPIMREI